MHTFRSSANEMHQPVCTPASSASIKSPYGKSGEPHHSTMEAVAADSRSGDCNLVKPEIDFCLHDLFYLAIQYVPIQGQPHLLYHKYLKVAKEKPDQARTEEVILPLDKLVTTIDMKIYRSSNRELVGSMSRCIELPNALPNLRLSGFSKSVATAGASRVFSLNNIINERMVQEANAVVAGIPGFHTIFFSLHRVQPGGKFQMVSNRVQPISNSQVDDLFAQGIITTDHREESWPEPGRLHLELRAPSIAKRKASLAARCSYFKQ